MSGKSGLFFESLSDALDHTLVGVRFDLDTDASGAVGNGYNDFTPGFGWFRSPRFTISVAIDGFDESSPRSCFELAQAAFHEARHVMHHVDRMQGRSNMLSDDFTFAYLAREQNGVHYWLGYPNNIFELDANAYSVVEAKRFCGQFFSGVDFDEIACDVWRKRCESAHTRFVTNWTGISSAEDIAAHMRTRIVASGCDARTVMCGRGDAVWDYMRTRASDTFCDLWRDADFDFVRDKLCAAVLVGSGFSNARYPNADALDWHVGNVDVLADVRAHQKVSRTPRSELAWLSEADVLRALGSAIESGLSLSSVRTGPFDHVSINRHGISIEHRAFGWVGPRRESEPMSEHVVDVALAGLADGSLVPFSVEVPDVVCEWAGRTSSYAELLHGDSGLRLPILSELDISVENKTDDDFELG